MFNYRCNCEHEAHGSRGCPSNVEPRTPARADYVRAVCNWCAHEHLCSTRHELVPPARCYYAEECEETHPTFILDARVADMSDEKASLQKVCDTCVHLHIAGVKRTHKMVVSVAGYLISWVSRIATLRHVSLKEPIATFYGADAVANASLFMSVLARIDLQRHEYVHFKK